MIALQHVAACVFVVLALAATAFDASAQPPAEPALSAPDRDRLRTARQLARVGRVDEAVRAYDAIFPRGMPDDDLALEYAQVVGRTKDGWDRGRGLLEDLARKHPDDPRYRVALASHMSTRKPVGAETLRVLKELSTHPTVAISRQAKEAWRRAVLAMDAIPASVPALREYIDANPGETAVKERLDAMQQEIARGPAPKAAPPDPATRMREAGWKALQANRLDESEARWREALAINPKSGEATAGLGLVRMRQGRHAESLELLQRAATLDPQGRAKWEGLARTARYWLLLQQARTAREARRLDEARALAEEARALDPNEGNAAAELARVHVAAGRDRDAEALLDSVEAGQRAQVRASIDGVRAGRSRDRAKELLAQGRAADAIATLEEGARLDPNDPWIRHDLARAYASRGEEPRGRALFEDLLRRSPGNADARYAFALFLSGAGREADAMSVLQQIPPADRSANMANLQRGLWASIQGQRARAFTRAGDAQSAKAIVAALRATAAGDPELTLEVARTLDRIDADEDLRAVLGELERMPATPERSRAIAELRASLARRDRQARLARIDTLMETRDFAAAASLVEAELAASPHDERILSAAARIAEREGRLDDAIRHEAAALADGSGDAYRYRRLAGWLDQHSPWYWSAVDWLHRSGTAGKSRISAQEVPLAWKQGWHRGGQWFVRVAPARVAAGNLDHDESYEVDTFGAMLLCRPLCTAGKQAEEGVALAAGLERGSWRFDLGTSPIGFPIVNAVGGVSYRGDLGPASYTVEASRRALASSLLSYAGVRDPHTGRTWGGVVANGVRVSLSRDSGGDYGAWALAGAYRLTGRDVQDNDKGEVMAGAYRRIVNEEDRVLTAGITGIYWRFSENAGEYTFGHGGYYSPKTYRSVSLPVTFAARTARTSYFLRASVSASWSTSHAAPFFPTDPQMQAAAEALTPTNFVDPHYTGGDNGRSYGRSFAGAVEHQLAPNVFAGTRVEIERSTNYTPNRFLLYVRFTLGRAAARPVTMPPESGLPGGAP